jgi:hypothetical protein
MSEPQSNSPNSASPKGDPLKYGLLLLGVALVGIVLVTIFYFLRDQQWWILLFLLGVIPNIYSGVKSIRSVSKK